MRVSGEVEPADVVIAVAISDGVVSTLSDRVPVSLGDIVELSITSDTTDEAHVHGYDILRPLVGGETVVLRFTADVPGIFEIELEGSGLLLLELAVS